MPLLRFSIGLVAEGHVPRPQRSHSSGDATFLQTCGRHEFATWDGSRSTLSNCCSACCFRQPRRCIKPCSFSRACKNRKADPASEHSHTSVMFHTECCGKITWVRVVRRTIVNLTYSIESIASLSKFPVSGGPSDSTVKVTMLLPKPFELHSAMQRRACRRQLPGVKAQRFLMLRWTLR